MTISFAAVGVQNDEPDIVVEQGEPFEMKCLAKSLGRLVKSRMDQTWIHNSTTFRHLNDVKPENTEKLKISSSKFSDSGIWNCRYYESSSNREWVTNVVRILVIPPRTLLQKILPIVIVITVCLIVLVVISKLYWNRSKKKKLDFEDEDGQDEYKYSKGNEYKRTNENEYKYSIADPYQYGEENEYNYAEESGIDEDELTPLFAENLRGFNNR